MQDLAPLDEIKRMRTEFLGLVSHELRAPLTAIKSSAVTLRFFDGYRTLGYRCADAGLGCAGVDGHSSRRLAARAAGSGAETGGGPVVAHTASERYVVNPPRVAPRGPRRGCRR